MSSLQIRAHFLLYREWACRLEGRTDLKLGLDTERRKVKMFVHLQEFVSALVFGHGVEFPEALNHSITGLIRSGLLEDNHAYGTKETLGTQSGVNDSPYETLLMVAPTVAGFELYGWAQGVPGMTPREFVISARPFAEDEIPRLANVALPQLPDLPRSEGPTET